ncbi:MAG: Rieske (2Fe-2S) protein [Acidilobaceae archaeon]|jgi:nitrite reductase/ring-hydroxylating ferredoxin subunit
MEWVRFAKEAIIPEGSARIKFFGGSPIMVLRSGGKLYAYIALCNHKYYVLCERSVKDDKIVCPGHGEIFIASTGEPTQGKARSGLVRLDLEVRDGYVYVKLPSRDIVESIASESLVEGQA